MEINGGQGANGAHLLVTKGIKMWLSCNIEQRLCMRLRRSNTSFTKILGQSIENLKILLKERDQLGPNLWVLAQTFQSWGATLALNFFSSYF